jgi:hypothetical protein
MGLAETPAIVFKRMGFRTTSVTSQNPANDDYGYCTVMVNMIVCVAPDDVALTTS